MAFQTNRFRLFRIIPDNITAATTTIIILEDVRCSYKPAMCVDSGFLIEAALDTLREGARTLFDKLDAGMFGFRRLSMRQIGLACRSFQAQALFIFSCRFVVFLRLTHAPCTLSGGVQKDNNIAATAATDIPGSGKYYHH